MDPVAEQLQLPESYGTPSRLLTWADVQQRLTGALHYWLATTRPDDRPHLVPIDGVWLDAACYFGGDPTTVHMVNLAANPRAVLHLDDSEAAVIVEGEVEWHLPATLQAAQLAAASKAKYGYGPPASTYRAGTWRLPASRILAWNVLYEDATRFVFR